MMDICGRVDNITLSGYFLYMYLQYICYNNIINKYEGFEYVFNLDKLNMQF